MYTTKQQALRWSAIHEIENMMGRQSFITLLVRDEEVFERFWSHDDPCFGVNGGYYKGYEAVKGYFAALKKQALARAEAARDAYPDELGGQSAEDLLGVGALHAQNLSTPVIELAGDMQTAKGLWYLLGGNVDFSASGWGSTMSWGRLGVDFVCEDGQWKIKNMVYAEDISTPMGTDWTEEQPEQAAVAEFAAISRVEMPQPNVKADVHQLWHDRRPLKAFPPIPEPYETFSETFSYGVQEVMA